MNPAAGESGPVDIATSGRPVSRVRTVARWALGALLAVAGTSHLTFARREFQAQVPPWVPVDPDTVVLASGVVEIVLGASTLLLPRQRGRMGLILAAFFVAVFPGNIAQYTHHVDGFGLDTDTKRFARLLLQPLLVAWALWSTGALRRRD
jgi:uncharacterized membrane protein